MEADIHAAIRTALNRPKWSCQLPEPGRERRPHPLSLSAVRENLGLREALRNIST
jgi:hypothetical protein